MERTTACITGRSRSLLWPRDYETSAVGKASPWGINSPRVSLGRSESRSVHPPEIRRPPHKRSGSLNPSFRRSGQPSQINPFPDPHVRKCDAGPSSMRCIGNISKKTLGSTRSRAGVFQRDDSQKRMEHVRDNLRAHSTYQPSHYAISVLYHGPCRYSNNNRNFSYPTLNSLGSDGDAPPTLPFIKGSFTMLDYRKLALPCAPECSSEVWIRFLPPNIQKFLTSRDGGMIDHVHSQMRDISLSELPRPRVWAHNGHYPQIIALCSQAGMIKWSRIGLEEPSIRRLRDALTMSSFGVTKDIESDRLISWPRIQNDWFMKSPVPSFPDPSAFSRIFADQSPKGTGFALDIANMFHNILLPPWLCSLFPLNPLRYEEMPANLKNQMVEEFNLSCPPPSFTTFRPMQKTLPMVDAFRKSTSLAHRVITLSGDLNVVTPSADDILIAHIIDDVNVVMYGFQMVDVRRLQHQFWRSFTMSGLPMRTSKCTPLNKIVTDSLPFIGFTWDLQTGLIQPKNERSANLSRSIDRLLDFPSSYDEKECERIVGKLVWTAMARRPLLSVMRSVFHLPDSQPLKRNRLSAARELQTISSLLPYAIIDTQRHILPVIIATDACPRSGAVTFAQSSREELLGLLSTCRYNNGGPLSHPEASKFALRKAWKTALKHDWRRDEHINVLEGEIILLALRWAIDHGSQNHRIVIMTDSSVCIGAITKGRSSSGGLLRVCRKIAALSLLHRIELLLVHISTHWNPADAPSRGLPISECFLRTNSLFQNR